MMSNDEEKFSDNESSVSYLHSLVNSLRSRVEELEAENSKLSSLLSNCHCREVIKKNKEEDGSAVTGLAKNGVKKSKEKKAAKAITGALNHLPKRYVALKVMYFGQRYYGFASEAQMDPTVESELFKALEKTRLLVGDRKESQYSRCGRTDKGVSSVGQVIALLLRSNLKKPGTSYKESEAALDQISDGEIDYVRVLNRVLPKDIRIIGWCPVPIGFHARFSCLSRQYKYFFWRENLNILDMDNAGKKLIEEHDFRNFCKMDAANVHNYRRNISSFEIFPYDMRYEGNEIYVIKIKGSAFLWHQVRCIVSVLFMIGQGLESSDLIDTLLDVEKTPRKPQYTMAPEIPLVLQSCEFTDVKFICSPDAGRALHEHLINECQSYQLQAAIFHEAILNCLPPEYDLSSVDNGPTRRKASHIPIMSRPTEPSYKERRAKFTPEPGPAEPLHLPSEVEVFELL